MGLPTFNVLSLCTGYGGLELGLRLAIGNSRVIACVEHEAYACEVLATRMESKELDQAPIWSDVVTFNGKPWRGVVDCITGGYPCQPFSGAGKRLGDKDPRHIWPDIARIIGEVQPEWVFLENVANHIRIGFREVRGRLQDLGYRVEAGLFTASEIGAPHERARLFILAHHESVENTIGIRWRRRDIQSTETTNRVESEDETPGYSGQLAHPKGTRDRRVSRGLGFSEENPEEQNDGAKPNGEGKNLVNANNAGLEGRWPDGQDRYQLPSWPPSPTSDNWRDIPEQYWPSEKTPERKLCGMANGTSVRVERLRLLGNGVVPVVATMAWIYLRQRFAE